MIARRDVIAGLGAASVMAPVRAWAQQSERIAVVGVLLGGVRGAPEMERNLTAIKEGLRSGNWIEGQNIRIETRYAADVERFRYAAAELVGLAPAAIIASTTQATLAVQHATSSVPIVFAGPVDPVKSGFARSLSHPGGNLTGFTGFPPTLGGKWVEILIEVAPSVQRILILLGSTTTPTTWMPAIKGAAADRSIALTQVLVRDANDIESAIASFAREPGGGLLPLPDPFFIPHRERMTKAAARYRLPAMYPDRFVTSSGSLVSYGYDVIDLYRRAGGYLGRILNGEKPGDLAVQAPIKYVLVINLKTARALSLTIPPSLLARADEVIE